MIKIQHLKNILDLDFKNNKTYELEICRNDIKNIFNPNPYDSLFFNNNRSKLINSTLTINDLYDTLKKNINLKTLNCIQYSNLHQCLELNKSYIYLINLIKVYKNLNFSKLLSYNFNKYHQLYDIDIIYLILQNL